MMVSVDKGSFEHRHTNRENQSREERDQVGYGQLRGPKITCQMERGRHRLFILVLSRSPLAGTLSWPLASLALAQVSSVN